MLLSLFPSTFLQTQKGNPLLIALFKAILVLIGNLKLSNLLILLKQKSINFAKNLSHVTAWGLLIMFLETANLLCLLYLMALRSCLLHLIKKHFFVENISKNSNINAPVTPKLVEKLHPALMF